MKASSLFKTIDEIAADPVAAKAEIENLEDQIRKLRKAIRMVAIRPYVTSGSLQMADNDAFCREQGVHPAKIVCEYLLSRGEAGKL